MNFNDWLNCLPYDEELHMDELLRIGEALGLKLDREESNFLANSLSIDLTTTSTQEELENECKKSGIRIK